MTSEREPLLEIDKDELLDFAKQLRDYKNLGARQSASIFKSLTKYYITIDQLKESKIGQIITQVVKQDIVNDDDKKLKDFAVAFFNQCKGNKNNGNKETGSDNERKAQKNNKSNGNSQSAQEKRLDDLGFERQEKKEKAEKAEKREAKEKEKKEAPKAIPNQSSSYENFVEGDELAELPLLYPDYRNTTLKLFKESLMMDFDHILKEEQGTRVNALVTLIEKELNQKHKNNDKSYKEEVRALKKFLSQPDHPQLRERILNGELTPKEFCFADTKVLMSQTDQNKLNDHGKDILESKRSDYMGNNVAEGFYQCKKCKSKRTIMTQQQTRSADEPMTTFVVCVECKHTMKFN